MSLPPFIERPSGNINSVNKLFTLNGFPFPQNSLHLFWNGFLQIPTIDYFISGNSILFVEAPTSGKLLAHYRSCNEDCPTFSGSIGLAGSGEVSSGTFIAYEVPPEAGDGINTMFSLVSTPVTGSLRFYYNGQLLVEGATEDYTLAGTTVTTTFAPIGNLWAHYRLSGDMPGLALTENNLVNDETPSGVVDGVNVNFTLEEAPLPSSLALFDDGQLLLEGVSNDYVLDGVDVTFNYTPLGNLWAHYQRSGLLGGTNLTETNFVDNETPSGTIDGINTVFTLVSTPAFKSLQLYHEGQQLRELFDYTLSGLTITTVVAPTGNLRAYYRI